MQYKKYYHNKKMFDGYAVAFGNFDGVHIGHKNVILNAIRNAKEYNLKSAVITFDPHPAEVLSGASSRQILSFDKKIQILQNLGVDEIIVINFDFNLSKLHPEEFIKILCEEFNIKYITTGMNFHFGWKRSGNVKTINALGKKYNFISQAIHSISVDDIHISSSKIRQILKLGCVKLFSEMTSRKYKLESQEFNEIPICDIYNYIKQFANNNNLLVNVKKLKENILIPPCGAYLSDKDLIIIKNPFFYTISGDNVVKNLFPLEHFIGLIHNFNNIDECLIWLKNCYNGAKFLINK